MHKLCVLPQEVSLTEEVTAQRASLSQALEVRKKAEGELAELREESTSQIALLVESVEQKSKAGDERVSMFCHCFVLGPRMENWSH